jgi:hypothetical protein
LDKTNLHYSAKEKVGEGREGKGEKEKGAKKR